MVKGGLLRGLEVLAHDRGVEPPAQPRLVAGDGLLACCELLLELRMSSATVMAMRSFPTLGVAIAALALSLCGR